MVNYEKRKETEMEITRAERMKLAGAAYNEAMKRAEAAYNEAVKRAGAAENKAMKRAVTEARGRNS